MEAQETVAVRKVTIRPDTSKMVKSASGSFHKDDLIGNELAGLSLDQVKQIAGEVGIDHSKWSHLNNGQQRMIIGSTLRKINASEDIAQITSMAGMFREENEAAAAEKAAEKAAALNAKLAAPKKPRKSKAKKEAEAEA